jgi:predicted ATP-dependent protease
VFEVLGERLRWRCDPEGIPESGRGPTVFAECLVGQERALGALRLGLNVDAPGYNIFVTGDAGTGRTTAVRALLAEHVRTGERPPDICYVNNFERPERPLCVKLHAGDGRAFKRDVERRVKLLRARLPILFESKPYRLRRAALLGGLEAEREATRARVEALAAKLGFDLVDGGLEEFSEPAIRVLVDGEPIEFAELEQRVEEGRLAPVELERLRGPRRELSAAVDEMMAVLKALRREERRGLEAIRRETALIVVRDLVGDLRRRYTGENVAQFLDALEEDVLDRLALFLEPEEGEVEARDQGDPLDRYGVNLLVDNGATAGRPVIFETAPNFHNLFGMIEKRYGAGDEGADYRDIRAGSLVRANGGFLILNAADVLGDDQVWTTLKRTLRTRKHEIQSYDPYFHFNASALKPVPIDITVKVIVIGTANLYEELWASDAEFSKIFKVLAEFDSVIERNACNAAGYGAVVEGTRRQERLRPVDQSALAAIIEHGVRLAGQRNKLSARFGFIADVLREAEYWARVDGAESISDVHVWKAVDGRVHRSRRLEEKIREEVERGELLIDIDGSRIGQVNGLTIYDLGFYRFGTPVRITASASIGRAGIINIEKEVGMSGASHNKGVLILAGFLQDRYAQSRPLSLSASLAFEQSYSGVDGDSASSTEIYAMLSALSELPIRQDIAATGSVNQKGDIQPIGSVNEKAEGFFDICRTRGLTGRQGVIIPAPNVDNLQLRHDVVEAVDRGRFHVWAVATVDEGIELLTGVQAGARREDGSYPAGSVNDRVNVTLQRWATTLRRYFSA